VVISVFAFSLMVISTVTAAPNATTFGGNGGAWTQEPLGPGKMYTNVHNGLILHWVPGLNSPHHVGLITEMPGLVSNGAVENTPLPGASDVKLAAFWGPPPTR
jgi:hypothetical protein